MLAREFRGAFDQEWAERTEDSAERERMARAFHSDGSWTRFMLGCGEPANGFLHAVARRLERCVSREWYTLDCVFLPEGAQSHRDGGLPCRARRHMVTSLPSAKRTRTSIRPLRGETGARRLFEVRNIRWWQDARNGDDSNGTRPTRNMASSQIACVNFHLPLVDIPEALLATARALDGDVTRIVPIHDQSPVEFEWIGLNHALEGPAVTILRCRLVALGRWISPAPERTSDTRYGLGSERPTVGYRDPTPPRSDAASRPSFFRFEASG